MDVQKIEAYVFQNMIGYKYSHSNDEKNLLEFIVDMLILEAADKYNLQKIVTKALRENITNAVINSFNKNVDDRAPRALSVVYDEYDADYANDNFSDIEENERAEEVEDEDESEGYVPERKYVSRWDL